MLTLDNEYKFEVKEENKVGHMRCDFQDGGLANTWFPTKVAKEEGIDLKEIQEVVNEIMFNNINSMDKVIEICEGKGYNKISNRFVYKGDYNYWIKLIPVKGDYNYYIHVYKK